MDNEQQRDAQEANLQALLRAAAVKPIPALEAEVAGCVQRAIRRKRRIRHAWRVGIGLAVAATLALAARLFWLEPQDVEAGTVRTMYGLVAKGDAEGVSAVAATEKLVFGEWIETQSGSKAAVELNDGSRVVANPRTRLRITHDAQGVHVTLERGFVEVTATKQPKGKALIVESPGATTRILGTSLNVRVAQRQDGNHHTRVRVVSGEVQLEAAGERMLLVPSVEGTVEEGSAPLRRSLIPEVNELIRLCELNARLAAESGVEAGLPRLLDIRDDGAVSLWAVLPISNKTAEPLTAYNLAGNRDLAGMRAFTSEGFQLPVTTNAMTARIDLSTNPLDAGGKTNVLVNIPHVKGLIQADERGLFQFDERSGEASALTVLQFRLPASASVASLSPKPMEEFTTASRRCVTVVAELSELGLFH